MKSKPNELAPTITTLKHGATFQILDLQGDWMKIKPDAKSLGAIFRFDKTVWIKVNNT